MTALSGVTITCFSASYAVVLALEVSRLWFRSGVRGVLLYTFAGLGLFTHTVFLVNEAARSTASAPLSSWREWYIVAAWVLAAVYVYLAAVHPRQVLGVFLLPLVLGLIVTAHFLADRTAFPQSDAMSVWATIHGIALLLGTVVVSLGFAAGVMYLVQDRRLRAKRGLSGRLRLPSLEWLDRVNGRALVVSVILLSLGVLSGVVLNQLNHRRDATSAFPWTDPVVWTSLVLLAWLVAVSIFGAVYKPARNGRKVAYLTLASFAFLLMVLAVLLFAPSQHGSGRGTSASAEGARP
ncbi:MAG: cytochrome C assembly protein [Planctomycetota bacterium]|nr:MAG: cytochrome C assembly protein [Planctomycetota bacterium]